LLSNCKWYIILENEVMTMTTETPKNIEYTLSTFAVEGLRPSDYAVRIYENLDEGKISLSDAIKAIKQKHNCVFSKLDKCKK